MQRRTTRISGPRHFIVTSKKQAQTEVSTRNKRDCRLLVVTRRAVRAFSWFTHDTWWWQHRKWNRGIVGMFFLLATIGCKTRETQRILGIFLTNIALQQKKYAVCPIYPRPPNQCWSLLRALWSFRIWPTLCRGEGGCFTWDWDIPKFSPSVSSVSHQFCIFPILVFVCVYWEGSPGGGPESVNLICLPHFHLCKLHGEFAVLVVIPHDSMAAHPVPQVLPVQVGVVTIVVPPGACVAHSTVPTPLIIVLVLGGELHVVVIRQRVSRRARIWAYTQLVQRLLITNTETAIFGISPASAPVLYLHS